MCRGELRIENCNVQDSISDIIIVGYLEVGEYIGAPNDETSVKNCQADVKIENIQ